MQEQRQIFQTFLKLNVDKANVCEECVAHMQFYKEGLLSTNDPLLLMDQDDIVDELDVSSDSVRWLLHQLTTFDSTRQKIVGLIFDRSTVLSDVFWVKREIDRTD